MRRLALGVAAAAYLGHTAVLADDALRLARSLAVIDDRFQREAEVAPLRAVVLDDLAGTLPTMLPPTAHASDAALVHALGGGRAGGVLRSVLASYDDTLALQPHASLRVRHLLHLRLGDLAPDGERAARHYRRAEIEGVGTLVVEAALRRQVALASRRLEATDGDRRTAERYLRLHATSPFAATMLEPAARVVARSNAEPASATLLMSLLPPKQRGPFALALAREATLGGQPDLARIALAEAPSSPQTALYRALNGELGRDAETVIVNGADALPERDRALLGAARAIVGAVREQSRAGTIPRSSFDPATAAATTTLDAAAQALDAAR